MARTFGAAGTDRIDCGSAVVLDNVDPLSICAWVRPTSLVANAAVWAKNPIGVLFASKLNGTAGNISATRRRGGGGAANSNYISNNTPLSTVNQWYFVAWVYAGAGAHIYVGNETTLATEVTYGTAQAGSSTPVDDSAVSALIGNENAATPASTWNGQIAHVSVWNVGLTLAQVQEQQVFPHLYAGNIGFYKLDADTGTTEVDQSGFLNLGIVTGATVATVADPTGVKWYSSPLVQNNYQSMRTGDGMWLSERVR